MNAAVTPPTPAGLTHVSYTALDPLAPLRPRQYETHATFSWCDIIKTPASISPQGSC